MTDLSRFVVSADDLEVTHQAPIAEPPRQDRFVSAFVLRSGIVRVVMSRTPKSLAVFDLDRSDAEALTLAVGNALRTQP